MIKLEQALSLQRGDILYTVDNQKWRVNGVPKVWKRSPDRVQVPLKHGLYQYGYLTEDNMHQFTMERSSG